VQTYTRTIGEQLLYDVHRHTHTDDSSMTTIRRAHTRTTRERLLHDLHTKIDRYRHTHTYIHTTHTDTHTTHTHTHTIQEVANYVVAEVRRATRSGDLRCSRSASCHKQRRTTFMRTQGYGRQKKWRPPLRRLHLRLGLGFCIAQHK
jgi:hypothetical protein